ncbi:hypothetical protein BST61_g9352 [Cercospora zeina]
MLLVTDRLLPAHLPHVGRRTHEAGLTHEDSAHGNGETETSRDPRSSFVIWIQCNIAFGKKTSSLMTTTVMLH